jgi:Carboxypeptidase regulatory-like domain
MNPDLSKMPLCDQRWDAMAEVGDGRRFCTRCSSPVTDFRGMTKEQITLLHVMSDERVCGVYSPEHLKPVSSEPGRGRSALVTLALGASLLAARADAQVAERPASEQAQLPADSRSPRQAPDETSASHRPPAQDTLVIRGTVRQAGDGAPVAQAMVMVVGTQLRTITDTSGGYTLRVPGTMRGELRLSVGRIGMETRTVAIHARRGETRVEVADIAMATSVIGLLGVMVETRPEAETQSRRVGYSISRIMGSP